MAKLIIFDDRVRGVELPNRAVVVGRSLKADIPIRDAILSRKHCTLVPEVECVRFIDLKSANGSYVNGSRVDRTELEYDDIIEIGNTVMVLLENDTWQRGDGLASLRNPVKAQELVQRIRGRGAQPAGNALGTEPPSPEGDLRERESQAEREFLEWAKNDFRDSPLALDLFERYICDRVVRRLVRSQPDLRETLADALDRVLDAKHFRGDEVTLRRAVRQAIEESFEAAGLARSASEGAPLDRPSKRRVAREKAPRNASSPGRRGVDEPPTNESE